MSEVLGFLLQKIGYGYPTLILLFGTYLNQTLQGVFYAHSKHRNYWNVLPVSQCG